MEADMPCLLENIFLNCSKEFALKTVATIDFMKWIDPNFGLNTQIVLQNERMIRSISNVPGIGNVEVERLSLPEIDTIITQRRPPLGPFIYQLSIQRFIDHGEGTLLEWKNEFELNDENKAREGTITSYIRANDVLVLKKTQEYFLRASAKER